MNGNTAKLREPPESPLLPLGNAKAYQGSRLTTEPYGQNAMGLDDPQPSGLSGLRFRD